MQNCMKPEARPADRREIIRCCMLSCFLMSLSGGHFWKTAGIQHFFAGNLQEKGGKRGLKRPFVILRLLFIRYEGLLQLFAVS